MANPNQQLVAILTEVFINNNDLNSQLRQARQDTDLPDPIPRWFFHWWTTFGISADILTGDRKNRFIDFMKSSTQGLSTIEKELMFFFKIRFPWIMGWEFSKSTNEYNHAILARVTKIKWWKQFDESKVNSSPATSL